MSVGDLLIVALRWAHALAAIVWLGGGAYPADPGGMRVVSDPAVWTGAVRAWKAAHGY